ncbi:MAG: hypothetical protein ONB12_10650 [candidate division KSB1 bacterium]|nr:hypothetical protein [candidate division KSB1 bacterium]
MEDSYFITRITAVFFSYLVAALFIERLVEALLAVLKYLELRLSRPDWLRLAELLRRRLQRFYHLESLEKGGGAVLDAILWQFVTVTEGENRVLSADLVRLYYYRLISYVLTIAAAAGMTLLVHYDLVDILVQAYPEMLKLFDPRPYPAINLLLSILALSLGVQPLHQMISRIEKRLQKKRQTGDLS